MNLLIITQKVDIKDDNLGFFHRWLEKLAEKVDKLYIICLSEGEHHLPQNTTVYSLGKERGYLKLRQLFRLQKFLLKNLPKVDGIFFHMCPIYAVVSYPLAKIFRKKMILWFLHKEVKWKLKLAEKCVDKILTASKESCRLKNRKKIEITGHGIDTDFFKPLSSDIERQTSNIFKILLVGRISPIKDQETLIEAVDILVNQKNFKNIEVKTIGSVLEDYDKKYFQRIKKLIGRKGLVSYIKFLGGRPHQEIVKFYQGGDLLVNLCPTGGMDKVVLEAMACELPVLVCSETFRKDLERYADKLIFQEKNYQDLAQKILDSRVLDTIEVGNYLRNQVIRNHNLNNLTEKIIQNFKEGLIKSYVD